MKILRRFRLQLFWLNLPSTILITLLQRTPVLKLAAVADEMVIASPLGAVLRSALAATASLGVMHTLAGATELSPSQPNPASGTVGTPLTIAFSITGTTSGPESWTVGGAVPPGMSFSGTSSETLVLGGTPTTAGSYTVSIQAEDGPTGFQSPTFSYTVNISGGVTAVAPSITSHPSSQTVTEGSGVTFNASADGTPAPTLQWHFNGSPIGGATGTSYSIGSVSAGNAGTYTVVATNSAGSATSNGATLTVNPATVAPSISAHPSSQTVNAGANVSFSVSASGTPSPSYQWRKDGADIGGANSSTLNILNVQAGNAGTYTVLVSNSAGSVLSNGAVLAINVAPTITAHPSPQSANESLSAQFSVSASGTPSPSYQWQRLPSGSGTWADLANGGNYSGVATATLTVSGLTMAMSGDQFRGVATNSVGSATSNAAALTVSARIPTIDSKSPDQTVAPGGSVDLTVVPGGTAPFTYQWKLNGNDIGGANAATLNLVNFQSANAGTYTLLVTNAAGTATATIVLTLLTPPVITSHPANASADLGANTSFTVVATSTFAPGYQWQRQPAGGGGWSSLANGGAYSGVTTATLTLTGLTAPMHGDQFQCIVTNAAGSATSNPALLGVVIPIPVITAHPTDQYALIGSAVAFTVTASSPVAQTYQWQKGGVDISGATSATYNIASFQAGDVGSYRVVVTNSGGSATSNAATLAVAVAPTITAQPQGLTVYAGTQVTFTVAATSTTTLSYVWRKNGTVIPGATLSTYTIPAVQVANAGDYSVDVSNIAGTVASATATLTVDPASAPVITAQPVDRTIFAGGMVTFAVTVTGEPVPGYQWQVSSNGGSVWNDTTDGGVYAGSHTTTLVMTGVQLAASGNQYRFVATNVAGSATSNAATLTVTAGAAPTSVAAAYSYSLFRRADGSLWGMGGNAQGQLADGTGATKFAPGISLSGVADVAAGALHTLFIKSDATLWGSGLNAYGALGTGDVLDRVVPQMVATDVAGLGAGFYHSLFVKRDGTLWGMGLNTNGQIGNGAASQSVTQPVQVADHVLMAAAGYVHSIFVKFDGTVWAAGDASNGQFGNGSTTSSTVPVQVGSGMMSAAAGFYHTLFLAQDGSLWSSGANAQGQLGDGTNTDRTTKVQIATGVVQIAAAFNHSLFLKADGTLWAMGDNSSGQLGDGTTTNRATPVQVATNVASVATGYAHTLFIKRDGSLWGMGSNDNSQLGSTASTTPVEIARGGFTVPAKPGSLTATESAVLTYVQLGWAPTLGVSHYEVWRGATTDQGAAVKLADHLTNTLFADYTGSSGVTYYYWIKAAQPDGQATWSDPVIGSYGAVALAQTITFAGPTNQGYTATPIVLSATASSGLTVSFSLISGPANLSGSQLTLTGIGSVTVRASQAGDASYDAAPNVDRTFTVSANFNSWALGYFTAPELADANVSGPNADPDGDGFGNLVEYALGLAPRSPDTGGLPELSTDATHWLLTYQRPIARSDASCTVEYSTNLTTWTVIPANDHVLVSTDAGIETWQAKYPLASATNIFYRLKVSR